MTSTTLIGDAVVVADTAELARDDWLAMRRRGIGGSDVSAIAGLSRYGTPLSVWLDKTGVFSRDDEPTEAMEWGNLLESVVADEFSRRSGELTVPVRHLLAHPEHEWMLANLDRGVARRASGEFWPDDIVGVYEGKTTSPWLAKEWGTDDDPRVPDHAALQTHHYLTVTGLPFAFVAVLIGGQRLVWRRVERDDDMASRLLAIEAEFWSRVENNDPPAPIAADVDLLGDVWTPEPDKCLVLTDDLIAELAALEQAKADEKAAKARADEAKARVQLAMGDHEFGVDSDGRVRCSWKQVAATRVEAYDRAAYRPFLPKKIKETK